MWEYQRARTTAIVMPDNLEGRALERFVRDAASI